MAMSSKELFFAVFIIGMYLILNCALNLLNRWALGLHGLRFPLVMTASHMIFGAMALSPLMILNEQYASRHGTVLQNDWKGLSIIAVMNGFQIACNNASLTVMELSMNQVIRAAIPVLVALIAVCVENKVPSKSEVMCLFIISIGVMLAVWEESKNALLGIILTVVSSVMQAIQMSVTGRLMSGKSGKLNSFQMTFYTGPVAFVTLFPFALIGEFHVFVESCSTKPLATFGFLLGSCCVAVIYNVVLFQSVGTLSSVGTAILGNVKIVCFPLPMFAFTASAPPVGTLFSEAYHSHVIHVRLRRCCYCSSRRSSSESSAAGPPINSWDVCSPLRQRVPTRT